MFKRLITLIIARTKEFYRDRSALGWNILFPFLVIIGFSFIFDQGNQTQFKVGEIHGGEIITNEKVVKNYLQFKNTRFIEFINFNRKNDALDKLRHHRIDFLINSDTGEYWVSNTSPKGYMVEKLLMASITSGGTTTRKETIEGKEIPYIEWLFPGILGMNIMFSALFGVGFTIVRYRKNGVLKRISVAPVRTFEFLTAQIVSRMFVITATTMFVYTGCAWMYGFTNRGSYLALILVFLLGGFSLVALGLLVASRSSSEEFAGGILNMLSWPMMFFSEVWFSLEGANPIVITLSKFFPLTHMIQAARSVMNDGATIKNIHIPLIILAAMSIIFTAIGSIFFSWQKEK